MSEEEIEETELQEEKETGSSITSLDDALKVIDSLRKENANKRVKTKEVEEKAKKWEEHVLSQKTDLEKLTESNVSLEKQLADLRHQKLRDDIALKEGVPSELVQFMNATDENSLKEQAKKLASIKSSNTDFFAGQRGKSVTPEPKDDLNSWFTDMWRSVDEASAKRTL